MMDSYQKLLENTRRYRKTKKGILTNIYQHQKLRNIVNYSLKEFQKCFLNNKKFNRLYIEWIKNNYDKQYKPSIDRINCLVGYYFNNIQCMTWAENRYKQRMEFKRIRAKNVYQIMGNKIIEIYNSVSDVVKKTGLPQGNISSCLHGKRNYCGGYKWSYENPELLKED